MAKYLSETGLQTVWSRIDSLFLRKASVDTVPTSGSTNLITSGGMYSVLEELEDTVAASENSLNTRLSAIEGMNLVTGTGLTADKLVLGNGNSTVKTSSKGITTTAPSSSSDDTTIPTSAAVNSAISSALGTVAGALKYKGTVASNSALPANHSVGDVYVVSTAGTFVGKACEVGDYIVCNTSGTAANNAHWDVLNGENQVSNAGASLAAAGESATIATVDGTNITVTTPSTWTGLTKTGTITKVGNTASGDVAVSSSNSTATFGNAVTVGTVGGVDLKFTMPANPNSDTKVTQTPTTSSNSSWRPLILGSSYSDASPFAPAAATDITYSTHLAKFKPSTGVLGVVGLNKMTTSGTVTTGSDTTVWNTNGGTVSLSGYATSAHNHDTTYVKLNPGAAEQTIESSISSAVNGVVEFYRSSGDHICFIGFSNKQGTTKTSLGAIGFRNSSYTGPYYKNGSNYYALLHEGNYTSYVNTTNFPGLNSTGTITKVGNTSSGAVTVSSAGATIGTSDTTIATIGGVDIKAKIGTYLTTHQTIKQDGITGATVTRFGTCGIAAGTAAKTVNVGAGTVTLEAGLRVTVKFTYANTANSPTLNVNSTGAKNIFHKGSQITSGTNKGLLAGTVDFVYDGTQWQLIGNYIDTNSGGTVTSVTLTSGTGITVSDSGTAITGSGSRTISLASGVATAGTYKSVTVDTYGRVTSGTNPTTLSGYGITDAKIASGVITLGSNTITPLTSHQTIKQNGITGATRNCYGTCSTAAATAAKTVSVTSGTPTLETGLKVTVYFSAKNTANSPTLNVNSLGAKSIYHNGAVIGSGTNKGMLYGAIDFVYNSTLNSNAGGWQIVGNYVDSNTHNSHALTVTNGTASATTGTITYVESVTGCDATTGDLTATTTRKSISVLSSHQTIKQDGITGATVNRYGTCSTAAGTAAKTVSVGAGTPTLETGLKVTVYFSAKNTANSPTLNVNSLGAKSIYHNGALIGSGTNKGMLYGAVDFVYDSTLNSSNGAWQLVGNYVDTTGTEVTDATVQGWGYTKGIKFKTPGGGAYNSTTQVLTPVTMTAGRYLKDTSWTDITFSPSSGTNTINAVPIYRQDATWGDWVFYWEGMNDEHESNGSKGGLIWKNGEFVMAGNFHCANSLAFYQSGTYVPGSINTGTIGASFYANNNGGGDANSSAFFINVSSAAGGWNGHETFRFDKDGIYAYPVNGRTGITGWFINESDALTTSEIDSILANA